MRKLLENIKEKKFYDDQKEGTCRVSPSDLDHPVCSSGEVELFTCLK